MRIKEVEQRTGLTAKAIRLYESKGLLKPARETENDYRDYSEEDVSRLKTIAILRKLDVPVRIIKDWTDGKTTLRDILQKAADQSREESEERELRCRLASDLVELVEADPDCDLGTAAEELGELNALLNELDQSIREDEGHIGSPLYTTLIALGPILCTVFGILDGAEKDSILIGFFLSLVAVLMCASSWRSYLKTPKKERRHSGCLSVVLFGVLLLASVIGFWMWMSTVQLERFTSADSDILLQRPWQLVTTLFLILELTAGAVLLSPERTESVLYQKLPRGKRAMAILAVLLIGVNVVMFYGSLTAVSVANEKGIMRYSFFDPDGTFYAYTDVEQVETGFKGKVLGIPMDRTGDFYYKVTYSDGITEDWGECTDQTENETWTWMYRLDEWIMDAGAEKTGSDEYSEYCEMEQFYVDILIDVINNR